MFTISGLAGPGYGVKFECLSPGYFPELFAVTPDERWTDAPKEIVLWPHAKITGQLTDQAGKPLASHFIYLVDTRIPYKDLQQVGAALTPRKEGEPLAWKRVTNQVGAFEIGELRTSDYALVFGSLDTDVMLLHVAAGEARRVELKK